MQIFFVNFTSHGSQVPRNNIRFCAALMDNRRPPTRRAELASKTAVYRINLESR